MDKLGLLVILDAKPGKEQEVEELLKSAQPLADKEQGTTAWYAARVGPVRYVIFDTFVDEQARDAHLNGEIAKNIFSRALELFESEPDVHNLTILAEKTPGARLGARAGGS